METVLGLSVTSSSVGWVLLDGPGVDAAALDHDVFDVPSGSVDDEDISKHVDAVRGLRTIADASGHELKSIGITWTADAAATANLMLAELPDLGFEKVVSVRLSEATRTWAHVYAAALGFEKAAVCVLEPSAATVLSFGYGAVRTFATHTRESDDGLSRWLTDVFDTNLLDPEHLFLVGSRGDIELVSGGLSDALPMPVVTSNEAQLVLARGAALAVRSNAVTVAIPVSPQPDVPRPMVQTVTAALGERLAWFTPPVRAAAALVVGVVALFALGPELVGQPQTSPTENHSASNSSATSVSIEAVPAPASTPPPKKIIQRLVRPTPAPLPTSAPPLAQEPENASSTGGPVTVEPLAVSGMPVAQVPEVSVPQVSVATVPAEVAHLPEQTAPLPAETPHLPARANLLTETAHLPSDGTPHLPGVAPPGPVTPTQAASSPVWDALP